MESRNKDLIEIGYIIRQERKRKNMTIAQLAEKANLAEQTIGNIENGKAKNFTIDTFIAIIDTLDLSADFVLGKSSTLITLEEKFSTLSESKKTFLLDILNSLDEYDRR